MTGTTRYLLARHEHSVMNAIRTATGNTNVPMPCGVREVVRCIPRWLEPLTSVIDGDLFRERIVEQEIRSETWSDTRVIDRPLFGRDPCILLGQFVVTGWGPRDIEKELERQESESLRAPMLRIASLSVSMLLGALTLVATYLDQSGDASVWIAPWMAAGAIISRWQFPFNASTSRLRPHRFEGLFNNLRSSAIYAFCLGLLSWLIAWWTTPLALAITLALAAFLTLKLDIPKEPEHTAFATGEVLA